MTVADFEAARNFHHECLMGSFFSRVSEISSGALVFSDLISDTFWNYLFRPRLARDFKAEVAAAFKAIGRVPCVIVDSGKPPGLRESLQGAGFTKAFEEVWMQYQGDFARKAAPLGVSIQSCSNSEDFEEYLKVFFAAFGGSDPKEPYGALPPAYGLALERAFVLREKQQFHFFLLRHEKENESEVAGCAMLACRGEFACLYGLGVKPEFRGRGFARLLAEHRVKCALDAGARAIFLQTEAQSYNERLFRGYGFEPFARTTGFVAEL